MKRRKAIRWILAALLAVAVALWGISFVRRFFLYSPYYAPNRGVNVEVHNGILQAWVGFTFDDPPPYDQWRWSSNSRYWVRDDLMYVAVPWIEAPSRRSWPLLDQWDIHVPLWIPCAVLGLLTWHLREKRQLASRAFPMD
jgi:hypothetical protein